MTLYAVELRTGELVAYVNPKGKWTDRLPEAAVQSEWDAHFLARNVRRKEAGVGVSVRVIPTRAA